VNCEVALTRIEDDLIEDNLNSQDQNSQDQQLHDRQAQGLAELLLSERLSTVQIQQLSPVALAYLGDAIYELYVRRYYLIPPKRIQLYHHQVVAQVRAESQANHLQSLLPHLTSTELDILKRGRNAATVKSRRIDPEIYQQASSLETLIGYLYLTDLPRLTELFAQLNSNFSSNP
jgi:ribonuclease-3 family protein